VALSVAGVASIADAARLVVVFLAIAWIADVSNALVDVIDAFASTLRRRGCRAGHVHPAQRQRYHCEGQ
jgi:hypothetical protein